MRMWIRLIVTGAFCAAIAATAIYFISSELPEFGGSGGRKARTRSAAVAGRGSIAGGGVGAGVAAGSGEASDSAGSRADEEPDLSDTGRDRIEDCGLGIAMRFHGAVHDPQSLTELRDAILARGRLGTAVLKARVDSLGLGAKPTPKEAEQAGVAYYELGSIDMYEGRFTEAIASFEKARDLARGMGVPARATAKLDLLTGILSLRRGETDNCMACLGPSSCIMPIAAEAVHTNEAGSRDAIKRLLAYLKIKPRDFRARWLLNIAYMTLGEYPDRVPREHLIPLDKFQSKTDVGRFQNVAAAVGLTKRGPNQAGGSIFDDFTGDGLPDLFTTSLDADRGASFFVNLGNGEFADRSSKAGLDDQIYALNVTRTDFNNDGFLDVLMLRGGWEKPMRLSLLKNKGNGTFEDVTVAAGLGEPIACESAAWGDYDDDGYLDVFLCGEYTSPSGDPTTPDPRNRCRLYHNERDGTFVDRAAQAGVLNERCGKGSGWGDYDGDGKLDLLVSNMRGPARLYHNEGNGKFVDKAPELGVTGPEIGFACWFWDFDNDGKLDIYINENDTFMADYAAIALGEPNENRSRPTLYRNLGAEGFRDVAAEVGLARAFTPMGCNFGDVNNDGFLDIYLGTGEMSYSGLTPNVLLINQAAARFDDATWSSATGHLQKGHGVSFCDWDFDGDLDFFVETGGGVPGDRAYNLLFQNPGQGRRYLEVKLIGVKTNKIAIGAKIGATITNKDGSKRSIYRTIGNNSSFGGDCLIEHLGLLDSTKIDELEITWPTSKTKQTFHDVAADRTVEIVEGVDRVRTVERPRIVVPSK